MGVVDFVLVVGPSLELREAIWGNKAVRRLHAHRFVPNAALRDQFPGLGVQEQGEVALDGALYLFQRLSLSTLGDCYLFSSRQSREVLFERAFERLEDGIQLYDKDGYLIYCNETSRRISTIPKEMDIIGRHMLEIWNVQEEKSAALSCIKANAPVKNRVDTFHSIAAGEVTTVNTAYPLSQGDAVKGAVLFERDATVLQNKKREIEVAIKALRNLALNDSVAGMTHYTFDHIVGNSAAMQTAVGLARKFAVVDCHVLLIGETGTGKEMFAQSIHRESSRSQKDFVAINCASMPETLIESMLFGTVKGSFTGSENKAGLFEEANGGTLFLDELNSMSLAMQSNLLRIVQEGVYRRVGGSRDLKTDVRIISSSNEDPYLLIEEGRMRRDLFYRLSSVQIQIPPLRDRLEDLGQLVERYIQLKRRQFAKEIDYVTPEVLSLFRAYRWPGNVRELFHVLDYAMNMMDNGVIDETCLPPHFIERLSPDKAPCGADIDVIHSELEDIIGDYESRVLKKVLQHYGNNISHAAASLGISRQRLSYRIRKYGIVL